MEAWIGVQAAQGKGSSCLWSLYDHQQQNMEIKSQMSSEELNKRIQAANKDAAKTAKLENSDERKPRKAGEMAKMKIKEASMSEGKY